MFDKILQMVLKFFGKKAQEPSTEENNEALEALEKIEALEQAPEQAPVSKQPLPPTPPVNPEAMKDPMVNTNLMQTGLTQTEQALLSNEEKSIRLRQRGMSA